MFEALRRLFGIDARSATRYPSRGRRGKLDAEGVLRCGVCNANHIVWRLNRFGKPARVCVICGRTVLWNPNGESADERTGKKRANRG